MRIVAIGDTHGLHRQVAIPDGDLLVHAGDLTRGGNLDELPDFVDWIDSLPHTHKIVIAGNHDWCFQRQPNRARWLLAGCTYLQDQAITLDGITFYGSPWQPWFHDWAFNLRPGVEIAAKWELIPAGVDVMVTHGPPYGHGDRTWHGEDAGCRDLMAAVARVRPRMHIFGHIHEGAGRSEDTSTVYVNASCCDLYYAAVNPPIVLDLA